MSGFTASNEFQDEQEQSQLKSNFRERDLILFKESVGPASPAAAGAPSWGVRCYKARVGSKHLGKAATFEANFVTAPSLRYRRDQTPVLITHKSMKKSSSQSSSQDGACKSSWLFAHSLLWGLSASLGVSHFSCCPVEGKGRFQKVKEGFAHSWIGKKH